MASSLSDKLKSRNLIDEFLKFTKQIALEIVQADIEIAIYLIDENLPKDKASEIKEAAQPGVVLVSSLKEHRLLSENNLDFFIELLEECRRVDLANRVRDYQKTSVKTVKDAPQAQIEEKIPAHNKEFLSLVIPGHPRNLNVLKLDHIRASICEALGLKESELFYVATEAKNGETPISSCSQVNLQLPLIQEKLMQLQMDALNKRPWLTKLKVLELKVDHKSAIMING